MSAHPTIAARRAQKARLSRTLLLVTAILTALSITFAISGSDSGSVQTANASIWCVYLASAAFLTAFALFIPAPNPDAVKRYFDRVDAEHDSAEHDSAGHDSAGHDSAVENGDRAAVRHLSVVPSHQETAVS